MNIRIINILLSGLTGIMILTGCSDLLQNTGVMNPDLTGKPAGIQHPQPEKEGMGVKLADYILSEWPDPDTITSKQWEYTNGIVLSGIEKIYEKSGDRRYLDYIRAWVDQYVDEAGNISPIESEHNLDVIQPANLLFTLYTETQHPKYKRAATLIRQRFDRFPATSEGGFWHKADNPNEMWLDGQYMAVPFLVRYASHFAETDEERENCFKTALHQLKLVAAHTLNQDTQLMHHAWDADRNAHWADRETGTSPEVWSRAMGWYAMALVDTMEYLPETYPGFEDLRDTLATLASGLTRYQDPHTGLWHQVIDKDDRDDNWEETSGSAMIVYALKKAAVMGYIDLLHITVAEKGWNGVTSRVSRSSDHGPVVHGSVQAMGVQPDYAGYVNKKKVDNLPHGLAAVMMAASVMEY